MDARRAIELVEALLDPWPAGLTVEVEDHELLLHVRRDLLHLDADALHDRLHHWTLDRLARELPRAHASVSFRRARPASPHEEATLDAQEAWLGLEPTLAMEFAGASEADLAALARLVPAFLALVDSTGRPAGFRRPDAGMME